MYDLVVVDYPVQQQPHTNDSTGSTSVGKIVLSSVSAPMPQIRLHMQDAGSELYDRRGFNVVDTGGRGDCQFSSLAHLLRLSLGIEMGAADVRAAVVEAIREKRDDAYLPDGTTLASFITRPFDEYVSDMARQGTYGDHITLQLAATVFNVRLHVHRDDDARPTIIVPLDADTRPAATVNLRYLPAPYEHYQALVPVRTSLSRQFASIITATH
jgi:hypothetical protein